MGTEPWPEPRQLIEKNNGELSINDATASELEKVDKPVVAVCIAGTYRTGKSYLMNRLANRQSGFALGSTVESKTKGIWVWVVDHPLDPNKALLLMDTEGLEDAFSGDDTYDTCMCCLAILLSSVFVYNILGKIDQATIHKLAFVSEISRHIKASTDSADSDKNFDEFFPYFILAVRDFTLVSEIDGKHVTSDEYMEHMLLSMKNSKNQTKNEKVRCDIKMKLRSYFKERSCFCFPRPVQDDMKLNIVDALPENDLEEKFLKETNKFCTHIYSSAPVKLLDRSHAANGRIIVMLARQYVSCIRKGKVPCVDSAVDMVSKNENTRALDDAVTFYRKTMADLLTFPVTAQHLADCHQACHKQAVEGFSKKAFLDRGQQYHKMLQEKLLGEYERIVQEDAKASWNKCHEVLRELFASIEETFRNGGYICCGGYEMYLADMDAVKAVYYDTPDKGVKSEEALLYVLSRQGNQQLTIMKADEALSEAEKRVKDEQIKSEVAGQKIALEKKQYEELKRHQASILESHREHLKTLEETFAQKVREQEEEYERLIGQRLDERKRLLDEDFKKEADILQTQVDELQARKKVLWKKMDSHTTEDPAYNLLHRLPNLLATALCSVPHIGGNVGGQKTHHSFHTHTPPSVPLPDWQGLVKKSRLRSSKRSKAS